MSDSFLHSLDVPYFKITLSSSYSDYAYCTVKEKEERDDKQIAQGHTPSKWQSLDSKLCIPSPEFCSLPLEYSIWYIKITVGYRSISSSIDFPAKSWEKSWTERKRTVLTGRAVTPALRKLHCSLRKSEGILSLLCCQFTEENSGWSWVQSRPVCLNYWFNESFFLMFFIAFEDIFNKYLEFEALAR